MTDSPITNTPHNNASHNNTRNPNGTAKQRLFIVMFLVVAPLIGAAGGAIYTLNFLHHAIAVPGQVVAVYRKGHGRGSSYHSKVDFVTKAGQQIFSADAGYDCTLKAGDQVTILYRADAPAQTATIDHPSIVWDISRCFLIIEWASIFGSVLILATIGIDKAQGRL